MIDDIEYATAELLELLYDQNAISPERAFPVGAYSLKWNSNFYDQEAVTQLALNRRLIFRSDFMGVTEAALTADGIAFVQRLRRDRSDPHLLTIAMRAAILYHIHDQGALYGETWDDLEWNPQAHHLGRPFSPFCLTREAQHLQHLGLIKVHLIKVEGESDLMEVYLTEQGKSCVTDFGGNVAKSMQDGGPGNVTNNNVYISDNNGNLAIGSSSFTQAATSGVDTTELLKFAGAVRQILPTLDLAEDQAEKLRKESAELHEAASQAAPDVGLLRRLGQSILAALGTAAPTVASDLVLQLGEQAVTAISGG